MHNAIAAALLASLAALPAAAPAKAPENTSLPAPALEKSGERGTVMTVHIAAAPDRVFAAMTRCEQLPHWLDAAGRELTACTSDARTGGSFRYEFAANGRRFAMFGDFVAVTPGRIVHTESYQGSDWAPLTVESTFTPRGTGTVLRVAIEYPSAAIRDQDFPNLSQALAGYERLGAYLAEAE